ncbi:histone H2A-like [Cetorhinus maximus]
MSGHGKTRGKGRAEAKARSSRTGLQIPITSIHRLLHKGHYAKHVRARVYLATVLEYLTAEILDMADNAAQDNKTTCIIPHYLQLTIRNDEELNKLLGGGTIAQGGVLPTSVLCYCPAQKGLCLKRQDQKKIKLIIFDI